MSAFSSEKDQETPGESQDALEAARRWLESSKELQGRADRLGESSKELQGRADRLGESSKETQERADRLGEKEERREGNVYEYVNK